MRQQGSDVELLTAFVSLHNALEDLEKGLPPLDEFERLPVALSSSFDIAFTLTRATTIKLHGIFAQKNVVSRAKCLESAKAIVKSSRHIDRGQTVFLNPILGVRIFPFHLFRKIPSYVLNQMLWMVPCELFLENMRLGRTTANVEEMQLSRLTAVMAAFEDKSTLLRKCSKFTLSLSIDIFPSS